MIKRALYLFSSLLLLASCVKEPEKAVQVEPKIDLGISFGSKAGDSGSGSAQLPVVNSMRVLIFYGTDAGSETPHNLVYNTFYAFGFNTTKQSDRYNVALANQIVLPQSTCRNYNVYVVLNEEGFQLSGDTPEDLHKKLGDFSGNETALQNILSTPAVYSEVLKNVDEPAFLISGCKAVTFDPGELGSGKSVTVDGADGFNRGRSMAQIVINNITSEPADGYDYSSTDVPKIFVKSVTLENIPNTIAWSDVNGSTDGTNTTKMASQTVGAANTDGYYDRDWYGHVTRTITNLWAQKVQYTDAKFYRTGNNNADNKAWSFNVKPYRLTDPAPGPGTAPYTFIYAQGDDVTPALTDDQKRENVLGNWNEKYNNDTKTLLAAGLPEVFDAKQDGNDEMSENISYTSYEVTNVQIETRNGNIKTSIGPATMSDDYWTVRLGDKFYVPENIQKDDAVNATCLRVTLAIANPKFSFSLNKVDKTEQRVCTEDMDTEGEVSKDDYKKGYNYVDPTTLPSPSSLPGESSQTLAYTYYAGDSESGTLKEIKDLDKNWIKANGSVVWADDESNVLDIPTTDSERKKFFDDHGQFHAYIDGFSRRTNAVQTGDLVVNETLRGSYFNWNVNASTQVYDFVIPVNNNLGNDGDYSIHRNTRYTVTLYVNEDTYSNLSTKAGDSVPFTITAKVKTETVNCDEE